MLRYLLMPGPSPTPRPRAKARPIPTPTTPIKAVLPPLGLGRASGLAPRSMIICVCPHRCALRFAQWVAVAMQGGTRMMRERNSPGH